MTRLVWQAPTTPRYESGVDRVVVYESPLFAPYPWSGIISIDEAIQGGERTDAFFDGVKYNDFVASKNFQAIIRAFTYPTWVAEILGYQSIKRGVYLTRQKRTGFRLTYRTRIGDGGYKIHMVYGCSLVPITRSYNTINEAPDPSIFEWTINAVPYQSTAGSRPWKPTAHYILDSTKVSAATLIAVENRLYGTDTTGAVLSAPEVMLGLVSS